MDATLTKRLLLMLVKAPLLRSCLKVIVWIAAFYILTFLAFYNHSWAQQDVFQKPTIGTNYPDDSPTTLKQILKNEPLVITSTVSNIMYNFSMVTNRHKLRNDIDQQTEEDYGLLQVAKHLRSLPLIYLVRDHGFYIKGSCSPYPALYDILVHNNHWQSLHLDMVNFYFYGAYYDDRQKPVIRILAMADILEPKELVCKFWYKSGTKFAVSKTSKYNYIWHKSWGNYRDGPVQPFLITCPLPQNGLVPQSVTLLQNECDYPKNNLRVMNEYFPDKKKKSIAVCVKHLNFYMNDISVQLVEWLELLFILGADKVIFSNYAMHPNIEKVLRHYEAIDKVEFYTMSLPGDQPNFPEFYQLYLRRKVINKRQGEVIPYNDCLYRNLHKYESFVFLDIDEMIVPSDGYYTWKDVLKAAKKRDNYNKDTSFYHARNIYFFTDLLEQMGIEPSVPDYMPMSQNIYRTINFTKPGHYVKGFINPKTVLTMHNHFPFKCLKGYCKTMSIDTHVAKLQHYRKDCVVELRKKCDSVFRNQIVVDKSIWKYKNELINRTRSVLQRLSLEPN